VVYKTQVAKWNAVVQAVKERRENGQPTLLGTASIEKNELISALLSEAHIPHEVLNAKNNEREGAIIAQAGKPGAVTVATNMAGRGVDIILGGNPPTPEESEKVRNSGGLHVIGTERHEARRIDNQLRGRAGRQGDPGSSQFYLSLEDDLVRVFGGDRVKNLMERFNLPEDMPIDVGLVSRAVAQAQSRVEGSNFDLRKHLLEYDDILNKQRSSVYERRQKILESLNRDHLANLIFEASSGHLHNIFGKENIEKENPDAGQEENRLEKTFKEAGILNNENKFPEDPSLENLENLLTKRSMEATFDPLTLNRLLSILDTLWMSNLENLEALSESIGLRAYGQRDPLIEYRQESKLLFDEFWVNFNAWIFMNIFRMAQINQFENPNNQNQNVITLPANPSTQPLSQSGMQNVGRNDPCPCGAKEEDGRPKKFKHCHGK
jgi:preprotein translocase subunit SecA